MSSASLPPYVYPSWLLWGMVKTRQIYNIFSIYVHGLHIKPLMRSTERIFVPCKWFWFLEQVLFVCCIFCSCSCSICKFPLMWNLVRGINRCMYRTLPIWQVVDWPEMFSILTYVHCLLRQVFEKQFWFKHRKFNFYKMTWLCW